MRPQTYLHASRTVRFSRLLLDSLHNSSHDTGVTGGVVQAIRRVIALAMALLLLPMGQSELFAQQAPVQYAPYQQSGYVQPQPYAQQPYGQPYQQQPYVQPYQQQPYMRQSYSAYSQAYSQQQSYGQAQPLNVQQLEQLVAPIALYPDTLIAQVLTASTYPLQVVDADRWRHAQGNAYAEQIAAGADAQRWDPSVKALSAFPQVLAEMDQNLQWTTALGNAYYNQPQDILEAVQVMRYRAHAAGNLQNTTQEAVSYNQGNMMLAPVNPQIVYVPAYNPWTVYGEPVSPYPGFSLVGALGSLLGSALDAGLGSGPGSSFGSSSGSSPVSFGMGIAMAAFTHMPWGWLGWGLSWLAHSVLFQQSDYFSNSTTVADWGLPHGGPRAFSQPGGMALAANSYRMPVGYGRTAGEYNETQRFTRTPYAVNRPSETYNPGYQTFGTNYARSTQQAYNRGQSLMPSRPQQYGRSTYGSNMYSSGPAMSYSNRPDSVHGTSRQADRAPSQGYPRGYYPQRNASTGMSFAQSYGKPQHSGGFHLFGGGNHTPKADGGGKSFRGQLGGGGRSGGHGGGKHHFF